MFVTVSPVTCSCVCAGSSRRETAASGLLGSVVACVAAFARCNSTCSKIAPALSSAESRSPIFCSAPHSSPLPPMEMPLWWLREALPTVENLASGNTLFSAGMPSRLWISPSAHAPGRPFLRPDRLSSHHCPPPDARGHLARIPSAITSTLRTCEAVNKICRTRSSSRPAPVECNRKVRTRLWHDLAWSAALDKAPGTGHGSSATTCAHG